MMTKFLLSCIVIALLACAVECRHIGKSQSVINNRIYNGENARIEDFPYQVFLISKADKFFYLCGGVIIKENVILTAAHCTNDDNGKEYKPEAFTIRAGSTFSNRGGVLKKVSKVISHESYIAESGPNDTIKKIDNDIAMLILTDNLEFSNTIQPVQLANSNDILSDGEYVNFTGWGVYYRNSTAVILQKTKFPIVNQFICMMIFPWLITERMICAGYFNSWSDTDSSTKACPGDSGGPLVKDGKLYGIASIGSKVCTTHHPMVSVYSRVSAFRQWIDSTISEL